MALSGAATLEGCGGQGLSRWLSLPAPTGSHAGGDQDPTQTQPPRCGSASYTERALHARVLYGALGASAEVSVAELSIRE